MKQKVFFRNGMVFVAGLLTLVFAACPTDDGSSEAPVTAAIPVESVAIKINRESPDGDKYTILTGQRWYKKKLESPLPTDTP